MLFKTRAAHTGAISGRRNHGHRRAALQLPILQGVMVPGYLFGYLTFSVMCRSLRLSVTSTG